MRVEGEELFRRLILLNKKDHIKDKRVFQRMVYSQSSLYKYISRAKVTVSTLNLKKWQILIEIYGKEAFTVCLLKGE